MQGKVCLVTGANRGIGRATAEGLARQGATVLLACRDRDAGTLARDSDVGSIGGINLFRNGYRNCVAHLPHYLINKRWSDANARY